MYHDDVRCSFQKVGEMYTRTLWTLKLLEKSTIASKFKDDNNVEQDFSTSVRYTDVLGQIILCREGLFYA